MRVALDLCCARGGGTQAFRGKEDWIVMGMDNDKKFFQFWQGKNLAFVLADVTAVDWESFKEEVGIPKVDFVWASPPCERFSIANRMFPKLGIRTALEIVGSCLEAIATLRPKYWVLENPKGRLRWFLGNPSAAIRYSDYDSKLQYQKRTDLWCNLQIPMVNAERVKETPWRSNYTMPRNPSDRAFVPLGVSEAIYSEVQRRLDEVVK